MEGANWHNDKAWRATQKSSRVNRKISSRMSTTRRQHARDASSAMQVSWRSINIVPMYGIHLPTHFFSAAALSPSPSFLAALAAAAALSFCCVTHTLLAMRAKKAPSMVGMTTVCSRWMSSWKKPAKGVEQGCVKVQCC